MVQRKSKKLGRKKLVPRKAAKARKKTSKVKKRRSQKPKPKKAVKSRALKQKIIGVVTHYFPQVRAAVIRLKRPLAVGDTVAFQGHTTDFNQTVTSMQIDHVPIQKGKKGDEIGLEVKERVREHDLVVPAKEGFVVNSVDRPSSS